MTACGACAHSVRGRTALQGQLGTAAGSGRLAGPVPHRGQRAREVGRRLRQGGPRPLTEDRQKPELRSDGPSR